MIFGMSTACFFPHVLNEDAITLMGRMGIENIEIFFSCLSEYESRFVSELKKRADDAGVNVSSIHAFSIQFEPQLFTRHIRAREEALDIYKRVLDAGAALNAKSYVFHGMANVKRARNLVLDYAYVASCTDPLAQMAKAHGIKFTWENVHWCGYASPDFPKKLLEHITSDNLYFTLDVKQAVQSGYDPTEYIMGTQGRLANVHLCDIRRDDALGIIPSLPFHGEINFAYLKDALKTAQYDGAIILEVYSHNYKDDNELLDIFHRIKAFFSA